MLRSPALVGPTVVTCTALAPSSSCTECLSHCSSVTLVYVPGARQHVVVGCTVSCEAEHDQAAMPLQRNNSLKLTACKHYRGYPKPTKQSSCNPTSLRFPSVAEQSCTHRCHPIDAHRESPQATQGRYKLEANKTSKRQLALRAALTFSEILECVLHQPSTGRNAFLQPCLSLTRPLRRSTTIAGCDVWQSRENVANRVQLAPSYYRHHTLSSLLVRLEVKILTCGQAEWNGCRCDREVCAVLKQ